MILCYTYHLIIKGTFRKLHFQQSFFCLFLSGPKKGGIFIEQKKKIQVTDADRIELSNLTRQFTCPQEKNPMVGRIVG